MPPSAVSRETKPTLLSVAALPGHAPAQVVVEVVGEVSAATAPLLQLCLGGQVNQAAVRELVVDLRRVSFLGAAGVRVLLHTRQRCEARGGRFLIRQRQRGAAGADDR